MPLGSLVAGVKSVGLASSPLAPLAGSCPITGPRLLSATISANAAHTLRVSFISSPQLERAESLPQAVAVATARTRKQKPPHAEGALLVLCQCYFLARVQMISTSFISSSMPGMFLYFE